MLQHTSESLFLAYIHIHTCRTRYIAKRSRRRRRNAFGGFVESHSERAGSDDGQQVGLEELCSVGGVAIGNVAEVHSGVVRMVKPLWYVGAVQMMSVGEKRRKSK